MARPTFKNIIDYIKLLRIDIFMLLWAVSFSIPNLTGSKLTQDKYCISDLKADPELCLNLERLGSEHEELQNKVLKFSTKFGLYNTFIVTVPQILYAFALGYWLDKHPGHLRYLMALPSLSSIPGAVITLYNTLNFETKTMNLLWACVPGMFFGGMSTMIIGCYTYVARRTPPRYRSARFGVLQVFIFIPMSFAIPWGAELLYQKPMFGLHRNYVGVQMYTLLASLASGLWAVTMLYDAGDPPVGDDASLTGKAERTSNSNEAMTTQRKPGDDHRSEIEDGTLKVSPGESSHSEESLSIYQSLTEAFKSMVIIFTKERPNNKRTILACLMLSSILINIDSVGEGSVELQFVQKVYHWDILEYSKVSGALRLISSVSMVFLPGLLVNTFKMDEILLIIAACISLLFGVILKGGFLEPWALYAAGIIMIPSGLSRIGLQSVVSRVVDPNELARVFTFIGLTDSFGPSIAAALYTTIFNATLANAPWFFHFATCAMVMVSLIVFLWLDYTKHSWDPIVVRRDSRADSLENNNLTVQFKAERRSSSKAHVTTGSLVINDDEV